MLTLFPLTKQIDMPAFQPGKSGNPKGRPKSYAGVKKLRDLIAKDAAPIIEKLIALALTGDTQAARLLIERSVPAIRPIELPVQIPMDTNADLAEQGQAIITALAHGAIPPAQASQILTALVGLARLIELTEIEKRLVALEQANA